jgi:hypothetical protein
VIRAGTLVEVLAGRVRGQQGTVRALWREPGCGCLSLVVRLQSGREWAGKLSEVRPA